jgi:hypothetical protein
MQIGMKILAITKQEEVQKVQGEGRRLEEGNTVSVKEDNEA